MRRAALIPLLLLASPARAEVPAMDSAATCAGVAETVGNPEILGRCLADEARALARLEPQWDGVPLDIAGGCVARELEGGPGSYQILTLCIEDALAAAGLPSPLPPLDD